MQATVSWLPLRSHSCPKQGKKKVPSIVWPVETHWQVVQCRHEAIILSMASNSSREEQKLILLFFRSVGSAGRMKKALSFLFFSFLFFFSHFCLMTVNSTRTFRNRLFPVWGFVMFPWLPDSTPSTRLITSASVCSSVSVWFHCGSVVVIVCARWVSFCF